MTDTRIAYGAHCSWWDDIQKVGHTPPTTRGASIPACPHCGGVLFEKPNEPSWWADVDQYEADGHPGYRAMIEWARGKCFKNYAVLEAAYKEQANGKAN